MFSRNSANDRTGPSDMKPMDQRVGFMPAHEARGTPQPGHSAAGNGFGTTMSGPQPNPTPGPGGAIGSFSTRSIIGNDLTIMGQGLRIITKGTLQVDGKIEGDVIGNEVIIGERGHVTGIVSGESVTVRGQVQGTIKALTVALQAGAHVEGDVHHRQLSVEQGAHLDGRVRRPQNLDELKPDLNGV